MSTEAKRSPFLTIFFKSGSGNKIIYARAPASVEKHLSLNLNNYAGQVGQMIFTALKVSKENSAIILDDPGIENQRRLIQRIASNEIEIFENQEAFPEAFIVHNCRWISDAEKILKELKNFSQWDIAKEIILSQESPTGKIVQKTGEDLKSHWIDPLKLKEPISRIEQAPDYLAYRAYFLYPGFFFLNHQYLPGWRVFVDGTEWKIEKADYCFRAVFLDKGGHQIEFRYQPIPFRIGLFFSLSTIFSFLLLTIVLIRMRGRIAQM